MYPLQGTYLNHLWCSELVLEVSLEPVETVLLLLVNLS